jgi:formate C-acetyltransferase
MMNICYFFSKRLTGQAGCAKVDTENDDFYYLRPEKETAMSRYLTEEIAKSPRIPRLVKALYEKTPEIEVDRAVLITESYRESEGLPMITRRARAFSHILKNIPITIRQDELIVGSATRTPKGCQVFPEFSYEWLLGELDTIGGRSADPFYVSPQAVKTLR